MNRVQNANQTVLPRKKSNLDCAPRTQAATHSQTRLVIMGALLALGIGGAASMLRAQDDTIITSHGYSWYGNLAYDADMSNLPYVNLDAPKGGEFSIGQSGTFDSLNPYSRKGRAGGISSILYDQLIDYNADTDGEYYGILAESLEYPESKDWVIFHMRENATFADGTPVTAHDVLFSHNLFLEQGLPSYAEAVKKRVPNAEVLDDYTIKFEFSPDFSRRGMIETVGSTTVFSKAWFEADPENRRLDEPRLEVALGSGPYELDSFEVNRNIIYKRRDDYWAADLPIKQGNHNYDTIRLEYFGDEVARFEGFKGGVYTMRVEGDPDLWVNGYDFPAVDEGVVVKEAIPSGSPPDAVGFVFNLNRPQFADKNVRKAVGLLYNFEWTNESLLNGLYSPRYSFSQGTDIEATGVPEGAELEFLKSLGDVVPDHIFTTPVETMHESSASRQLDRTNRRAAEALLDDAGWTVGDDGIRRNADGETLKIEFLLPTNISDTVRAVQDTYAQNLQTAGIDAIVTRVDPSEYTLRRRDKQFDMIYSTRYSSFTGTGAGLQQMYATSESDTNVFNIGGLANPTVDAILEESFKATTQEEENMAMRALDRVLRDEYFIVPYGYIAESWFAYYDMYRHPDTLPTFATGYMDLWWIDPDAEAALKASGDLK